MPEARQRDGGRLPKAIVSAMTTPATFDATMLPHLAAAYNLARWLVRDRVLAEDVAQEAMVRALNYFASYRGGDARAWLLRIVRHVAYDALEEARRSRSLRHESPVWEGDGTENDSASFGSAAELVPDPAEGPEALAMRHQAQAILHRALASLEIELRECVVLREMEELSYREIARITGAPIGTVMSRLWRARQALMRFQKEDAKR